MQAQTPPQNMREHVYQKQVGFRLPVSFDRLFKIESNSCNHGENELDYLCVRHVQSIC